MPKSLRKNGLKPPDNFFDPIVDERECIHHRAALDPRTAFVELYRNLSYRVYVHLQGHAGGELSNYCAVFGYNPITNANVAKLVAEVGPPSLRNHHAENRTARYKKVPFKLSGTVKINPTKTGNGSYEMDDSMLIGIIYGAEKSKSILIKPIHSFVRLEPLNNCGVFRSDHSKVAFSILSISFGGVEDGELKIEKAAIIRRKFAQLTDEQVKR